MRHSIVRHIARAVLVSVAAALCAATVQAQGADSSGKKKKKKAEQFQLSLDPRGPAPLFTSETPIAITLTTNLKQIRRDKGANPPWRAATIAYRDSTGATVTVPVRLRTRGIWRLRNCEFPPLRLDFAKDSVRGSFFAKLDKPKLTTYCRDRDEYERYVLRELQAYRIYAVLTDYAHRTRLAHVTYADSATGAAAVTRYGIISEEAGEVAQRLGARHIAEQGAGPSDVDEYQQTVFSLFQYLIGNTDWSIPVLHNVELFGRDTSIYPVAYDFDFSGLVSTRYAAPDPQLAIRSVRQRLYRGYCVRSDVWPRVLALFTERRPAIYALYSDAIGKLLSDDDVRDAREYIDEFYATLDDPRSLQRDIIDQCIAGR